MAEFTIDEEAPALSEKVADRPPAHGQAQQQSLGQADRRAAYQDPGEDPQGDIQPSHGEHAGKLVGRVETGVLWNQGEAEQTETGAARCERSCGDKSASPAGLPGGQGAHAS